MSRVKDAHGVKDDGVDAGELLSEHEKHRHQQGLEDLPTAEVLETAAVASGSLENRVLSLGQLGFHSVRPTELERKKCSSTFMDGENSKFCIVNVFKLRKRDI